MGGTRDGLLPEARGEQDEGDVIGASVFHLQRCEACVIRSEVRGEAIGVGMALARSGFTA